MPVVKDSTSSVPMPNGLAAGFQSAVPMPNPCLITRAGK
jgi:hypothetical protein